MRFLAIASLIAAGCGPQVVDSGVSSSRTAEGLSGCQGRASSSVPSSGDYFLTSFGGGSDTQTMSCGGNADGRWWYAASRQRYGCGAHLQVEANGKCVVVEADDYGPDVCVENAAGRPILDASPLVAEALFGTSSAGWSDRLPIHVTEVDAATALGPCDGGGGQPPPPPPPPAQGCDSGTLGGHVDEGTCVQSASDGNWYHCAGGDWHAGASNCSISYPWCHSGTLGRDVPPRTCVQSMYDSVWYQCDQNGWDTPVADGAGPIGACSSEYPL